MPDIELIREAYAKSAQLVANFGDEFLPAFLRAEKMLKEAEEGQSAIARAKQVAASCKQYQNTETKPALHSELQPAPPPHKTPHNTPHN